ITVILIMNSLTERDNHYMGLALDAAVQAFQNNEVPIGAVVVDQTGELLGCGFNRIEASFSQNYHAEVNAINQACLKRKDWRLSSCTLYVTLEPCMMCISLCALSRIERIVYGASSPLFGFTLDKEGVLRLYSRQIKSITSGVRAAEAATLLKVFFKKERNRE
ncbi:MAG TPA: nucleoside deaminase, partial [Candidatus Babeliaceae bacterium]|nr:nucleoside deaminase [Candidatus Babeliaceae bacterium]